MLAGTKRFQAWMARKGDGRECAGVLICVHAEALVPPTIPPFTNVKTEVVRLVFIGTFSRARELFAPFFVSTETEVLFVHSLVREELPQFVHRRLL